MAIPFSSFFALGITLLSRLRSRLDLEGLLFGDILSITTMDVWQIAGSAAGILVGVKLFYQQLLFFTFDPLGAKARELPVRIINLGLMAAMTLTIVVPHS